MKNSTHRHRFQKLITSVLVVLWIGLSIGSDLTFSQETLPVGNIETQTADDQSETPELHLSEAVSQTININLGFQSFLMEELLGLDHSPIVEQRPSILVRWSKTARILFRQIIAPNAP